MGKDDGAELENPRILEQLAAYSYPKLPAEWHFRRYQSPTFTLPLLLLVRYRPQPRKF